MMIDRSLIKDMNHKTIKQGTSSSVLRPSYQREKIPLKDRKRSREASPSTSCMRCYGVVVDPNAEGLQRRSRGKTP